MWQWQYQCRFQVQLEGVHSDESQTYSYSAIKSNNAKNSSSCSSVIKMANTQTNGSQGSNSAEPWKVRDRQLSRPNRVKVLPASNCIPILYNFIYSSERKAVSSELKQGYIIYTVDSTVLEGCQTPGCQTIIRFILQKIRL